MRVLVTGAAGFLGSHLARRHLQLEDQVIGVDDFSTALGEDADHFKNLLSYPNFGFYKESIDADGSWNSDGALGIKEQVDLIYNFACPASPPRYQAMPIKTMTTSVVGTLNVLKLAKKHGARVVHASTSEVYGDPNISPQVETYWGNVNSYGPRSCYDEGKRAAEALCYDYLNKYDVDVRLVRIFNTYGPHMDPDDGRVVSNFIVQSLKGQKLTIYGNGDQTRSFCYVSDLIQGIRSLADLKENPRMPINIGNPDEFTILELAQEISDILGNKLNVTHHPFPVDDPKIRKPNIDVAREVLGFEPKVDLRTGLKDTIKYFEEVLAV